MTAHTPRTDVIERAVEIVNEALISDRAFQADTVVADLAAAGLIVAVLAVATVVFAVWGGIAAFTTGALLNGPTLTAVVLCLATLRAMWGAARTTTRSNP